MELNSIDFDGHRRRGSAIKCHRCSKRFMATKNVAEGALKRGDIERAAKFDTNAYVVRGAGTHTPESPHRTLDDVQLRERQLNLIPALLTHGQRDGR